MKKLALIFSFSAVLAGGALAQNPLGDASTFNAFIFGTFNMASDSDGAIAAGKLSGSQNINMHNHPGTLGTTTGVDVYGGANSSVGGNLDGSGGSVYLGTGSSFSANNNAGATKHIGSNPTQDAAFASDETYLKNLSATIAGYTVASTKGYDFNIDYSDQNNAYFHYGTHTYDLGTRQNLSFKFGAGGIASNFTTAGGVNIYVLDITASELSTLNSYDNNITFNGLDAKNNLFINVIGDGTNGVTWKPQQQTNSDDAYVLYNFTNTPTVTTQQLFTGSILATGSTIDQGSGDIQGNVIANGLNQTNELHFGSDGGGNYMGYTPQPVPEPASMVVLAVGAVSFLRRRK